MPHAGRKAALVLLFVLALVGVTPAANADGGTSAPPPPPPNNTKCC